MNEESNEVLSSATNDGTIRKRRRYTIKEKLDLVEIIGKKIVVDGMSMNQACKSLRLQHKQYIQWK